MLRAEPRIYCVPYRDLGPYQTVKCVGQHDERLRGTIFRGNVRRVAPELRRVTNAQRALATATPDAAEDLDLDAAASIAVVDGAARSLDGPHGDDYALRCWTRSPARTPNAGCTRRWPTRAVFGESAVDRCRRGWLGEIGGRLRFRRRTCGPTQLELAEAAGISNFTIRRVENGGRAAGKRPVERRPDRTNVRAVPRPAGAVLRRIRRVTARAWRCAQGCRPQRSTRSSWARYVARRVFPRY